MSSDAVIRTPDQRLRVFVSSSLDELAEERRAVSRAISALRLTPVMFELGARPHPPRDLYRAYLAQSDVFIGLYWQSYGHVGPGMELSGLQDEFELARSLPRLLYVKTPAPDREERLTGLLSRIEREASYRNFGTPAELGRLVRDDLATLLSERFAAADVPVTAPPRPGRLPVATTSLVGREQAIDEVAGWVGQPDGRLITLTGPGGVGKTRLAVAVGQRVGDRFDARTVLVQLAAVTDAEEVLTAIGRAVGANLSGADAPLQALVERFGGDRWLLILDNVEQVLDVARDLGELLASCPGLAILATSLTALRLRAEREYPVMPLPLAPDAATVPLHALAVSPAVALFVDRASAVRPEFALTEANAGAVVEICRLLEGLPLAIELAAARTRLLDPDALLERLATSLDALGTGSVDMPARQQTLRKTVEWSVGLLDDAERSLLETAAVFVDGWTIDAAAEVAGLEENRALDLTEALVSHSLIYLDLTGRAPRSRMLETIRAFVAERLAARPDAAEIHRRRAEYFAALAEQADRPLRGDAPSEWAERLQAESGNLAAAARWFLANHRARLPHLFRVLAPFRVLWLQWDEAPGLAGAPGTMGPPRPFWGRREDLMGEARAWVDELLPTADSLDPVPRAELLWTAAVTAVEASDHAAALAAAERLAPLLDEIDDTYLRALSHLAMSWCAILVPDMNRAVDDAAASVEELRGQDEPLWTAIALVTLGSLEMVVGRYDDAARHLADVRDRADRFDNAWMATTAQVQLGILALARGKLDDAWALLDEAVDLGLASRSTQGLTLSLAAFARLALAEDDPERAALLMGAVDELRRRAGVRVWTTVRGDAQVVAEIREALGPERSDQAFAAGAKLDYRHAAATARGVARTVSARA